MVKEYIEWHFWQRSSGREPVKEFLEESDQGVKLKIELLMELISKKGIQPVLSSKRGFKRLPGTDLYELKEKEARVLVGFIGSKGYLLRALNKKSNRIPKSDLKTAQNRFKEFKQL